MKKKILYPLLFLLAKFLEYFPFLPEKLVCTLFWSPLVSFFNLLKISPSDQEIYTYLIVYIFQAIPYRIFILLVLFFIFFNPIGIILLTKSKKVETFYWLFSTLIDFFLFFWLASKPCEDGFLIASCATSKALALTIGFIIIISCFILRSIGYLIGRLIIWRKLASR